MRGDCAADGRPAELSQMDAERLELELRPVSVAQLVNPATKPRATKPQKRS